MAVRSANGPHISRRSFLKGAALLGGLSALRFPQALAGEAKEREASGALLGMARGETVRESLSEAVELSGGLGFLRKGETVLVKPNVNTGDPHPASTNPEVVYELLQLLREREPRRIIVGDRSMLSRDTLHEMKKAGIFQAAREAGAEVKAFEDMRWHRIRPPGALNWEEGFRVSEILNQVDHIINLGVVKTHFLAGFTMSLKNFVGFLHPDGRRLMHSRHGMRRWGRMSEEGRRELEARRERNYPLFASMIAELGLSARPSLNILDGTRAFVSGGPIHGDALEPGIIIASRDRVAADVSGLALLRHLGTEERIQSPSPWAQPQIRRAIELGLGVRGISQIHLKAPGLAEIEGIRGKMV
ncbi:MAG: DUF362 domain-containing protein [Nitrospinota bacterium]